MGRRNTKRPVQDQEKGAGTNQFNSSSQDEHQDLINLVISRKKDKVYVKAAYTRARKELLRLINAQNVSTDEIDNAMQNVSKVEEHVVEVLTEMLGLYSELQDSEGMDNIEKEINEAEAHMEEIEKYYMTWMKENGQRKLSESPTPVEKETHQDLGKDMWKQLTRVSIPVFNGDKRQYASWKAAFTACIDKAPATPEYKLLQLKQYLTGEARRAVDSLGHSAAAYEAAKERLERKFGGNRRQIGIYLEELEQFRPVRLGHARDMDKLADLLDILVINLKDSNRTDELGNGSLYFKIQKKLPEQLLTNYHRWIFENSMPESVDTIRQFILREAEFQTVAAETLKGLHGPRNNEKQQTYFGTKQNKNFKCGVCQVECHPIWVCTLFKKMSPDERWATTKKLRLCFRCLRANHKGNDCRTIGKCGINNCQELHNRLLHGRRLTHSEHSKSENKSIQPGLSMEGESEVTHTTIQKETTKAPFIALRTIPVVIKANGKTLRLNALLDDASTTTYINADVAWELRLCGQKQEVSVCVVGGKKQTLQSQSVNFILESVDGNTKRKIRALTTENVTGNLRPVDWNIQKNKWSHLQNLAFEDLGPKPKIDMLIGADNAELHLSLKEVQGKPGEPIARLTPLGWTCLGCNAFKRNSTFFNMMSYFILNEENDLNATLNKFWEIESLGAAPKPSDYPHSSDDLKALDQLDKSLKFKDGVYEVTMPWKKDKNYLQNNYTLAVKRLDNTEKKLLKDSQVAGIYNETIENYLKKGYISKVEMDKATCSEEKAWYLPHFPVIRLDKETTKVRIVFDASAKCNGVSLNDVINQGPKLQRDLFDILLRFRKKPIALICDIAEMYLRIGIDEESRPYHRFLWRNLDLSKHPTVYEFNRLVFGVNSCPFQAQYVLRHHAKMNQKKYPKAAETILNSTYMDDSMDSTDSIEECQQLYYEMSKMLASAGMHARKWLSNSHKVLAEIPTEDRAAQVDLDMDGLPSVKTLGVLWVAEQDVFTFKVTAIPENEKITKRSFLSKIATLFDPLGFLAPFVIRAKVMMQELWTLGIDWDETLPLEQNKKAKDWFKELTNLTQICVPRCTRSPSKLKNTSLHTFTDASSEAYAAVIYAKGEYENGETSVCMIASKTKVAPLKAISIPRLELMGAVLGLRLANSVANVMKIDIKQITFWIDSTNVLWWIRNQSRKLKPFVANRIGEIQHQTNPEQWRYVPTKMNPADLPTRGMTVKELKESNLWWNGPEFLSKDKSEWPINKVNPSPDGYLEMKKEKLKCNKENDVASFATAELQDDWKLEPKRFSVWKKLIRIRAWVKRFINNCKVPDHYRQKGILTLSELNAAELEIIKETQSENFPDEYIALQKKVAIFPKSKLLDLNPMIDEDGLLRCNGRTINAEYLPYDTKFPIILPRKAWVTYLIVKDHHEKGNHTVGTNQLLSSLSSKFWIIHAREEIREFEKQCPGCKRMKAKQAKQIMAPLPKIRLKLPLRAFSRIAVDYAGPFLTIQGRGKQKIKRYLCLFTCLTSRAVHLEMAYSMETDSFLNAFFRMVNRRGLPAEVLSDNGTNFIGAERELRELVNMLDKEKISNTAANKGIKWQFNPPLAPHFGGVHESLIKVAKRAIYGILGNADVRDEELVTAFTAAEALMNSRPLTYQSANILDDVPLTPNHFLIGQVGGEFAPETVDTTEYNLRKRWRRVQELVRHFWRRWLKEYLPEMNRRRKWQKEEPKIGVGDIVLINETDCPRAQWPLARVLQVFPGTDGHVRTANVQFRGKTFLRPITKIFPLEIVEDKSSDVAGLEPNEEGENVMKEPNL